MTKEAYIDSVILLQDLLPHIIMGQQESHEKFRQVRYCFVVCRPIDQSGPTSFIALMITFYQ